MWCCAPAMHRSSRLRNARSKTCWSECGEHNRTAPERCQRDIDGKQVTKVGDVELGGLPEGAAFTPDGKYLFVGNYLDQDISILKVNGTEITDTGKRFKLPGHPASVRMSTH